MTAHGWDEVAGGAGQLRQCSLCGALALSVPEDGGDALYLAGFGPDYVAARPAPRCPPDCEGARALWDELAVEEVMSS